MAVVVDRIAGGGGVSIPVSLTTTTGATTTEGILLGTSSVATVGAQKFSPALHFQGSGWKTDATAGAQSVDVRFELQPVQGSASPTDKLVLQSSVNGGAYTSTIVFYPIPGQLDAGYGFTVSGSYAYHIAGGSYWSSGATLTWSNSASNCLATVDTGLSRISAGVVGVGTGAAGSVAGVISATSHMRVPLTVATLPAGATRGYTCIVTDASNPTFLATVVGGASTIAPVFYDGAAWKVG